MILRLGSEMESTKDTNIDRVGVKQADQVQLMMSEKSAQIVLLLQ